MVNSMDLDGLLSDFSKTTSFQERQISMVALPVEDQEELFLFHEVFDNDEGRVGFACPGSTQYCCMLYPFIFSNPKRMDSFFRISHHPLLPLEGHQISLDIEPQLIDVRTGANRTGFQLKKFCVFLTQLHPLEDCKELLMIK